MLKRCTPYLFCCEEEFAGALPVDDFPDGGEVIGAAVLVLEVVGMFPDIDAENGLPATAPVG